MAVLLVVTVAATLGGRLPATRALPVPPSLAVNLGRDPAALSFPPVTTQFLNQAFGPDAFAFRTPAPAPVARSRPTPFTPPNGPPSPSPEPTPAPSPEPSTLPLPFQFSELTVALRADRTSVAPGGTITYQAVVTNVGNQDFRGAYELRAHIPFGTVDATSPCGGTLGIDPAHDCVNPPVPIPGSPDPTAHQLTFGFNGTVRRGQQHITVFKVRVDETTQPGTELRDHTHLTIVGDNKPPTTSNTVVVVVRT